MKSIIKIAIWVSVISIMLSNESCRKTNHILLHTVLSPNDSVVLSSKDSLKGKEIIFDSLWQRGDVYGLAINDIFLSTPDVPILFTNNSFAIRAFEVFLKLDSVWIPIPRIWQTATNSPFHYDTTFPTLWIIPRMVESLHPGGQGVEGNPGMAGKDLDPAMRMVFWPAVIGWTLLGVWITTLRIRLEQIKEQ